MQEQQQHIRDNNIFKHSSSKKYLKIFVPDFAFKHDNDDAHGKDKFVGREIQFRRLYTWLTSDSKSGSYLITGYRGMGKSLLVRRVIEVITREPKAYKEVVFKAAMIMLFLACFMGFAYGLKSVLCAVIGLSSLSLVLVALLCFSNKYNFILFKKEKKKLLNSHLFDKEMLSKYFVKRKDRRERQYKIMSITINLGQEVLHERDVLSIMAQNIYEKYNKYVHNRQSRPFYSLLKIGFCCVASCVFAKLMFIPMCKELTAILGELFCEDCDSFWGNLMVGLFKVLVFIERNFKEILRLLLYFLSFLIVSRISRSIRKITPRYSVPFASIERLSLLCDRIRSTINEETGAHPRYNSSFFTLSILGEGKNKSTPMANVREIEQELLGIINDINGEDCPRSYRAQFVIVFDELDKITKATNKEILNENENLEKEGTPDFDSTVDGFTDAMAYEERKQNVLRLLANMKLFISSVNAKCIFISGHELFDASMADLSDREFAINSIFNGVLNVSSFLSPERGETDVSSMTELYVATMLIPENYLIEQMCKNSGQNALLKEEQPSLRWYYEYLMEKHIGNANYCSEKELQEREKEIMYAVEFLRYFTVFLSHISNGSPKKIATYFEKYIKTNYDTIKQFEWHDEIVVGVPSETNVRKQCVLYFDPNSQKLINFIYFLASPVMNAITNEVSNYGDKLLVSSSFMLDQIYKYHGKGFSWRNLEQMPELLTSNKNPELRDSMSSIVEFLLQVHIATISSGIFQYKFHKQISEEISALSKISEEASAIFNFTLNESEAVKRYNTRLLGHYLKLAGSKPYSYKYKDVLERLHENQGDIFFFEEDYYRAIHEYRSALQYITKDKHSPVDVLSHLKCSLKIGVSYEYRKTYENAYMMYCEIINNLIHLHWIEEGELGLDYTMRLTRDWRLKQTVLIDKKALANKVEYQNDPSFRRQFNSGLWEDLSGTWGVKNPNYSLDADKTISGLAALYTPEKSDLFERLTSFEDVKYIYQAIIVKLFVIEKLQLSGITQSSIEEAEAEFMTLFSDTNIDEKFMIAADFFGKMAEILYYKNNYVISYHSENLASALYRFDINVLGLLDDYCFAHCGGHKEDAIAVKEEIRSFFKDKTLKDVQDSIPKTYNKDSINFSELFSFVESDPNNGNDTPIRNYLDYLSKHKVFNIQSKWSKIKDCSGRIDLMKKAGCRLPCNACKYVNRSLIILMKYMFGKDITREADFEKNCKAVILLEYTSHKRIKHLRPSQLMLLASTAEQMANILLSCSSTDVRKERLVKKNDSEISVNVIELLEDLSSEDINESQRKGVLDFFKQRIQIESNNDDTTHLQKLDKVLLYYWTAYRFYEIAAMYKEAVQCVERMVKVLEDYLTVIAFDFSTEQRLSLVKRFVRNGEGRFTLVENLFKRAAVIVGRQYDSFDMAEIHENKWLFHLERADDVDLTKLSIFPNLQTVFYSSIKCKIISLQYLTKKEQDGFYHNEYLDYLARIYDRVAPSLRHEKTFKGEIESFYMKAYLNYLVWVHLLGVDVVGVERSAYNPNSPDSSIEHHQTFYLGLKDYLGHNETMGLDESVFGIDGSVKSKLGILNYLIHDSMVCLSNILKVLTPHNHITTFSNSFVAEIYDMLWVWSKYYELMYDLYIYYRYDEEGNAEKKELVVGMSSRNTWADNEKVDKPMRDCVGLMRKEGISVRDEFGYLYSKLLMGIRHEMDDSTIHHIYTNYSAEMAIKYYRIARDINSEGTAYKEMISDMYILNDDLHNDTCRYNLADERYFLNSGLIYTKRRQLEKMYERTNIHKMTSYEKSMGDNESESIFKMMNDRFADSLYMNTEY